jgi:hypothetical protein
MVIDDTAVEKDFRERYAVELRKKKVKSSVSPHFGFDELSDQMTNVRRQELATPGRRGEQIKKYEEIRKEIVRRISLQQRT